MSSHAPPHTAHARRKEFNLGIRTAESKKTIKPIAVGGQAGGEKYIVQGIFFKFATDIFGIYGGDEYAMCVTPCPSWLS